MKCPMLGDYESILRWRPTTRTLGMGLDRKMFDFQTVKIFTFI